MGISKAGAKVVGMKVTNHHRDDLHGILKHIDAHEVHVILACKVPDCVCLDFQRPFEVPQKCGKSAVAYSCMQTGVAAGNVNECLLDRAIWFYLGMALIFNACLR